LFGVAGGLIAVTCCAGLPAVGPALGGLTAAAVTGVGGRLLLVMATVAFTVLALRARRRRDRSGPSGKASP
jgi:hypothetical protein